MLDFLDKERFWDTARTVGGALVAGGAAIAAIFTPPGWATLTALGIGAAVGVGVGAYDLQGALTESRAVNAQRGPIPWRSSASNTAGKKVFCDGRSRDTRSTGFDRLLPRGLHLPTFRIDGR